MNMPQDPMMLLSMTNMYLRDQYANLEELCEDRDWEQEVLCSKLEAAGFVYQPEQNQFR